MEIIVVVLVIVIMVLYFLNSDNSTSSSELPGVQKAKDAFQKLPPAEKERMQKCINDVVFMVKNNVKYLPDDVKNMEYSKKTINAFVFYYVSGILSKEFSQENSYALLALILDRLNQDNILKFEDFNLRIFRDDEFATMPAMLQMSRNLPIQNNTLILVFIEKYMERKTGKRVRYMNQKLQEQQKQDKERKNSEQNEDFKKIVDDFVERSTPAIRQWVEHLGEEIKKTEKEKKVASVNGIELSQGNDLNILDRPDKGQEYWNVRNNVGIFLEKRFAKYEGFKWIRVEPMSPKFDDMSFAYKNKVFSVLIDIKYSDNDRLSKQEKDRLVTECAANNLIPCIFPVNDRKSLSLLSDEHWNLYDVRTNEIINPLAIATDEKVMMSNYEFNNMAVDIVKSYVKRENMQFESFCDIVGIYPQIWFKDKNNEMSWIYVTYSTSDKFKDTSKEQEQLIKGMPQFNGYVAQVGLACAEKEGPYRGAGFYVKFDGIKKIYDAHRDTGHGYGIKVKVQ